MSIRLHLFNIVSGLLPSRGGFSARRLLLEAGGVSVGRNTRIATGVRVYDRFLEIGEDTWVGMEVRFFSCPAGRIRVGSRVDLAPGCLIGSGTHEPGGPQRRAGLGLGKDVTIEDGCWVGMAAVILPGAHIGPGSVVAAGSVVTAGRYPSNSLLGGVPARVLRSLQSAQGTSVDAT